MSENANTSLWSAVEKTDPNHVKPITGKMYRGNSPKPYYLVRKATEVFGPCGIGWGFEILREHVEDGSAGDKVHIAHVRVWYNWNGQRGTVEHVGQTMLAGKNKNGTFTDEDAPKKSVTDALVKALSMIGFAGDIFIGRYDDSKYVDDLRREVDEANALPKPPRPPERQAPTMGSSSELRDKMIDAVMSAKTPSEFERISVRVTANEANLLDEDARAVFDAVDAKKDYFRSAV